MVFSGYGATGTVHLDSAAPAGGKSVFQCGENTNVQVPITAYVEEGQKTATFPVYTSLFFGPDQDVLIRTDIGGATISAKLKLKGNTPTFTLSPSNVIGGSNTRIAMTVELANPVGVDTFFTPTSSDDSGKVPATLKIKAGEKAFVYDTTTKVPTQRTVTLGAYYNNDPIGSGNVTIKVLAGTLTISNYQFDGGDTVTVPAGQREVTFVAPGADVTYDMDNGASEIRKDIEVRALAVSIFTISSGSVQAGTNVTGTVTLNVAVDVATTVDVMSQFPGVASVPMTVTIPAGSKVGNFTITTSSPGASAKNVKITVT